MGTITMIKFRAPSLRHGKRCKVLVITLNVFLFLLGCFILFGHDRVSSLFLNGSNGAPLTVVTVRENGNVDVRYENPTVDKQGGEVDITVKMAVSKTQEETEERDEEVVIVTPGKETSENSGDTPVLPNPDAENRQKRIVPARANTKPPAKNRPKRNHKGKKQQAAKRKQAGTPPPTTPQNFAQKDFYDKVFPFILPEPQLKSVPNIFLTPPSPEKIQEDRRSELPVILRKYISHSSLYPIVKPPPAYFVLMKSFPLPVRITSENSNTSNPDPQTAGKNLLETTGSDEHAGKIDLYSWPVFSWGISLACDISPHRENFTLEQTFDTSIYNNIRTGDLVYVRSKDLVNFTTEVLPHVPKNVTFTLVSGDGVVSIPTELPIEVAYTLLSSPQIKLWYTQNLSLYAKKMRPLPLGTDFHTVYINPGRWTMPRMHPWEQVTLMQQLGESIPLSQRQLKMHVSFNLNPSDKFRPWNDTSTSRLGAISRLWGMRDLAVFLRYKTNRLDSWRQQLPYAFVVSAYGTGLDCHRTWEALQLGHIVLMRHSHHAAYWPMLDGLPVVLLTDWSQITPDNLRMWHRTWVQRLSDPKVREDVSRRLSLGYWMDRIRRGL